MRKILTTLVALVAIATPVSALADGWRHGRRGSHHGRHHWHSGPRFVVGFGAPIWWGPPGYYGYRYGWPWRPPIVLRERVVERESVYVERDGSEEAQGGYWYFCRSEDAYYPDVERCPEAWLPVPPRSE
jgi:hypothetical protein